MKTTRRSMLERLLGCGVAGGLLARPCIAAEPAKDPAHGGDGWTELTQRIAALDARGGGTLELGDGVYELDQPLRVPRAVSVTMSPNAVLRARSGFKGDAVLLKGGGSYSRFSQTAGWIRGGVIDGSGLNVTGILVEDLHRLEIADLSVLNALGRGIHLLKGGNETNLTRVRCDVDMGTRLVPGSIGVHIERTDCKVSNLHVIGYETGVRSDAGSNWFNQVHVWNWEPRQGPMKICFHCNGGNNAFSQCYADSPTEAGFYINAPNVAVMQSRVYFSRWAADNTGAGFLITARGRHGAYMGNCVFADAQHRLARAFDGDLEGACILGTSTRGVLGGFEHCIPSGSAPGYPALNLAGGVVRLQPQAAAPKADEGAVGELRWVDDATEQALWMKTSQGWKRAKLV